MAAPEDTTLRLQQLSTYLEQLVRPDAADLDLPDLPADDPFADLFARAAAVGATLAETRAAAESASDASRADTAALEAERAMMRTLIDNIPDYLFVKDRESRIVINNKAHAWLLGNSTPEQVIGKSDFDFFPRELAEVYRADERTLMEQGEGLYDHEEESVSPAGESSWHLATKLPLHNAAGEVTGLVGIVRDITARKQAELARDRHAHQLATIAAISTAATSILDPNDLLVQAVELIRERFALYYTGIFLLDEQGGNAVLSAATGEAGRAMIAAGHTLAVGGDSMIGQCISTRQARIALDVGAEAVRFANPYLPDTRSEMALPLVSRDQPLGAMTIQSAEPGAFTPGDIAILRTMADQIANAIQNARLFEQAQDVLNEREAQAIRLSLLNELGVDINMAGSLDEVCSLVTHLTPQVIEADYTLIALVDKANTQAEIVGEGGEKIFPSGTQLSLANTMVGQTIQQMQALFTNEAVSSAQADLQQFASRGLQSVLSVPLLTGQGAIGAIIIASEQPAAYTYREEFSLLQVASLLTAGIENHRLFQQTRDALATVQQNERLMRTIIDATPDWIFLKDREHRYVLVNKGYANDLHLEPEDFVGKDDLDLGFPEELVKGDPERGISGFWADDDAVMNSGKPHVIPYDVVMIDDQERILNTIKVPMQDEHGKSWGVLGLGRDVTEREQLLGAEQAQRELAETLADISLALASQTGLDDVLTEIVEQARRLVPYTAANVALVEDDILRVTYKEGYEDTAEASPTGIGGRRYDTLPIDNRAIQTRRPVVIPDTATDPDWQQLEPVPWRSYLVMPIVLRDQVLGLLRLNGKEAGEFSQDDTRRLEPLVNAAAVALENNRLLLEARSRAAREERLNTITAELQSHTDITLLLNAAMQELGQALGARVGRVRLGSPTHAPEPSNGQPTGPAAKEN
ncbi:MAG: GAF domain-containing protein [Anaerolineae bacterium]|nr:GAF domain-containing protein [Anaerolineae bacterium]